MFFFSYKKTPLIANDSHIIQSLFLFHCLKGSVVYNMGHNYPGCKGQYRLAQDDKLHCYRDHLLTSDLAFSTVPIRFFGHYPVHNLCPSGSVINLLLPLQRLSGKAVGWLQAGDQLHLESYYEASWRDNPGVLFSSYNTRSSAARHDVQRLQGKQTKDKDKQPSST